MRTILLLISVISLSACQKCWECETKKTYRYKDTGEIWKIFNTQSFTCDKQEKKEIHKKTRYIEGSKYNIEMYSECKVKFQ